LGAAFTPAIASLDAHCPNCNGNSAQYVRWFNENYVDDSQHYTYAYDAYECPSCGYLFESILVNAYYEGHYKLWDPLSGTELNYCGCGYTFD